MSRFPTFHATIVTAALAALSLAAAAPPLTRPRPDRS
jgi:hypothetical protein